MSKTTHVALRAGERIFINGAVVRADRKVSLELLNDVPFLLEHQIMQPEQTTSPMRQLYFILQTMVIDPRGLAAARDVFEGTVTWMLEAYSTPEVLVALRRIRELVRDNAPFEALKTTRTLFPIEDIILGATNHTDLRFREAV